MGSPKEAQPSLDRPQYLTFAKIKEILESRHQPWHREYDGTLQIRTKVYNHNPGDPEKILKAVGPISNQADEETVLAHTLRKRRRYWILNIITGSQMMEENQDRAENVDVLINWLMPINATKWANMHIGHTKLNIH